MPRNENNEVYDDAFCVRGSGLDRFEFVTRAAVKLAATSVIVSQDHLHLHQERAEWAFDAAEALWVELCKRFEDDSVRLEREAKEPHDFMPHPALADTGAMVSGACNLCGKDIDHEIHKRGG